MEAEKTAGLGRYISKTEAFSIDRIILSLTVMKTSEELGTEE